MKCEICGGSGVKCKIECGMRWSLKAGTCQRKVCDYKVGCQDCNGSGIQPEQEPKCKICKDTGEDRTGENPDEVYSCPDCEPEQTEDEKIRENVISNISDFSYFNEREQKMIIYGYKSASNISQQEIEELKACNKILAEVNLDNAGKIAKLKNENDSRKCCGNCDQENLQADCLITAEDITRHNYKCANWKQKP